MYLNLLIINDLRRMGSPPCVTRSCLTSYASTRW